MKWNEIGKRDRKSGRERPTEWAAHSLWKIKREWKLIEKESFYAANSFEMNGKMLPNYHGKENWGKVPVCCRRDRGRVFTGTNSGVFRDAKKKNAVVVLDFMWPELFASALQWLQKVGLSNAELERNYLKSCNIFVVFVRFFVVVFPIETNRISYVHEKLLIFVCLCHRQLWKWYATFALCHVFIFGFCSPLFFFFVVVCCNFLFSFLFGLFSLFLSCCCCLSALCVASAFCKRYNVAILTQSW